MRALSAAPCLFALLAACGPSDRPPRFDDIGNQEAFVGQELVIDLRASDPDGDVLTFGFSAPSLPDLTTRTDPATISALGTDGSQARFRWKPKAPDVGSWVIEFEVTDGNVSVAETTMVMVKPEVGVNQSPTFVKPGGGSVDLDTGGDSKCLDLDIVVEDPDSARVTITQEPVVQDGMRLTDNGDKTAKWHWCPTPTQIAAQDRYRVYFSANDGVSGKSTKSLLINIIKPQQMNCPGSAPSITHSPTNVTTLENLKITAQISDDKGLKAGSEPLLYYTTMTPPTPIDVTNATVWQSVPAMMVSGNLMSGSWAATIPNPVASSPMGTKATIYYVWSARDNDDATGDCDHTTYEPRTGTFQMTVTSPGGTGNQAVCTACTADAQCGGATDNCITIDDGKYCGKGCSGDTDCAQPEYQCSTAALTSANGASARQCVPRDGSCTAAPPTCMDDAKEPNDNLAMAATGAALEVATVNNLKICPDMNGAIDEDWFKVVVPDSDAELTFTLMGGTETDLDLQLTTSAGTGIGLPSASNGSSETLTRCLTPGTYYVRVYSSATTIKETSYKLSYTGVNKSCSVAMCMDDSFEPDDDKAHARVMALHSSNKVEETNHQICADDDDWYMLILVKDEVVHASLKFTQDTPFEDLDFHFHDSTGLDLTPCSGDDPIPCSPDLGQSGDSNEYFERTIPKTDTYYLRVTGFDGSENKYDICVSLMAGQCPKL